MSRFPIRPGVGADYGVSAESPDFILMHGWVELGCRRTAECATCLLYSAGYGDSRKLNVRVIAIIQDRLGPVYLAMCRL